MDVDSIEAEVNTGNVDSIEAEVNIGDTMGARLGAADAEHEHGALLAQRLACQHRAALALIEVLPASELEPPSFRREHPSEPEPSSEAVAPPTSAPPRPVCTASPALLPLARRRR